MIGKKLSPFFFFFSPTGCKLINYMSKATSTRLVMKMHTLQKHDYEPKHDQIFTATTNCTSQVEHLPAVSHNTKLLMGGNKVATHRISSVGGSGHVTIE